MIAENLILFTARLARPQFKLNKLKHKHASHRKSRI